MGYRSKPLVNTGPPLSPARYSPQPVSLDGGSGTGLPAGTPRDSLRWDEAGHPIAGPFTADQWSDFPNGAPTSGQWLAAAQFDTDDEPDMGFVEVAIGGEIGVGKIPFYGNDGTLPVGEPVQSNDAATKEYVDVVAGGGDFQDGLIVGTPNGGAGFAVGDSGLSANVFSENYIYLWGVSLEAGMIMPGATTTNRPTAPTPGSMYFDLTRQKMVFYNTAGEWEIIQSTPLV